MQIFVALMLIPLSVFIVNGIRVGFVHALRLSVEPLYTLANGSPSLFYLLEAVAIVVTTLFLLWIYQRYWRKSNWWLIPIFFVGVIGAVFTGFLASNYSPDWTGLRYQGCGAYLSNGFNVAVEKQDISFCSSPHDYTRVNTHAGFKGGDYCTLPGGNTVSILLSYSNKFDPFFSDYCFRAFAVQTKQPNLCLETLSSANEPDVRRDVKDCIQNYARRYNDVSVCELLTRDERNNCLLFGALWVTRSIKTCEAIDTDSRWKNYCLERMTDRKP